MEYQPKGSMYGREAVRFEDQVLVKMHKHVHALDTESQNLKVILEEAYAYLKDREAGMCPEATEYDAFMQRVETALGV